MDTAYIRNCPYARKARTRRHRSFHLHMCTLSRRFCVSLKLTRGSYASALPICGTRPSEVYVETFPMLDVYMACVAESGSLRNVIDQQVSRIPICFVIEHRFSDLKLEKLRPPRCRTFPSPLPRAPASRFQDRCTAKGQSR